MSASKKRPGEEKEMGSLWVVLETDADGDEGIVARVFPGMGAMPLVASTRRTAEMFLADAKDLMQAGVTKKLQVVRFDRAKVVRALEP